jgi:hypothetical protein
MLRRLLAAAGRLHVSEITRICADRFPSLLESGDALSSTAEADWDAIEETIPADPVGNAAQKVHDEKIAEELLPRLSEQDRTVIRYGDDPVELARMLGVGRSSAYSAVKKLRARLIELGGDSAAGARVRTALVARVLDVSPDVPSNASVDMEDSRDV